MMDARWTWDHKSDLYSSDAHCSDAPAAALSVLQLIIYNSVEHRSTNLSCVPGLGPMYSCTRVHILEYSDVLYTQMYSWHDVLSSVLVFEYIHKVLVLSEYIQSTFP